MAKPIPNKVVVVDHIPKCDFCASPGPYDFKTIHGPWAHGCQQHWMQLRDAFDLGLGKGQFWITSDQVTD